MTSSHKKTHFHLFLSLCCITVFNDCITIESCSCERRDLLTVLLDLAHSRGKINVGGTDMNPEEVFRWKTCLRRKIHLQGVGSDATNNPEKQTWSWILKLFVFTRELLFADVRLAAFLTGFFLNNFFMLSKIKVDCKQQVCDFYLWRVKKKKYCLLSKSLCLEVNIALQGFTIKPARLLSVGWSCWVGLTTSEGLTQLLCRSSQFIVLGRKWKVEPKSGLQSELFLIKRLLVHTV